MGGQLDELLASLPCQITVFSLLYFVYCTVTDKYD